MEQTIARDGSKKFMIEELVSCHSLTSSDFVKHNFLTKLQTAILSMDSRKRPLGIDGNSTDVGARPKGGVCFYFKEHVPIVNRPDLALTNKIIISGIIG